MQSVTVTAGLVVKALWIPARLSIQQLGGFELLYFLGAAVILVLIALAVLLALSAAGLLGGLHLLRRRSPRTLALLVVGSFALVLLGVLLYDGSTSTDRVVAATALVSTLAAVGWWSRKAESMSTTADVFLCHVSEDKETIARPIANALERHGISYWLDEAEMRWGDRIRRKIDSGLRSSRYVIVIVTANFLSKESDWTEIETTNALATELALDRTTVLPLVVDAEWAELEESLGGLFAQKHVLRWKGQADDVSHELAALLEG